MRKRFLLSAAMVVFVWDPSFAGSGVMTAADVPPTRTLFGAVSANECRDILEKFHSNSLGTVPPSLSATLREMNIANMSPAQAALLAPISQALEMIDRREAQGDVVSVARGLVEMQAWHSIQFAQYEDATESELAMAAANQQSLKPFISAYAPEKLQEFNAGLTRTNTRFNEIRATETRALMSRAQGMQHSLQQGDMVMDPVRQRKDTGLYYDVEYPLGVHDASRDGYSLLLRFNALDPRDPARKTLLGHLLPYVAPDIQIASHFMIPDGTNFHAGTGVVIYSHVHMGDDGLIELGNNVVVGAGATFEALEHPMVPSERISNYVRCLPIKVGDGTIIGARTTVMPGVTIGKNIWVANDSIVTKDIRDKESGNLLEGWLVGGKPAKPIRQLTHLEITSGVEGFKKLSPGIDEFEKQPDARRQSPATAGLLKVFNSVPQKGGLFGPGGAIAFLAKNVIPSMLNGKNNNVFIPFFCELGGDHLKFEGSSIFINTGGVFYDAEKPITIKSGVFFGPKATVYGGAYFGEGSWMGDNVIIGKDAVIGKGAVIGAGVRIPDGAEIPDFAIVVSDFGNSKGYRIHRQVHPQRDSWNFDNKTAQAASRRLDERGVVAPVPPLPLSVP